MPDPSPSPATERPEEALGLAHVATASFVGARVAPSAQFWLSLPGGVALARSGRRFGLSRGYGASLAAMLQGVAILGPLRVNGPLTQAITAPLIGRLRSRGAQFASCLVLRLLHYAVLNVLAVWLLLGGIDGYVKTYESVTGWLGFLPQGRAGALIVAGVWQLAWALLFTTVQVAVYRRALRQWPEEASAQGAEDEPPAPAAASTRDARALAVAALIAFGVLLSGTSPLLLGAVAAWLAVAWLLARPDPQVARVGFALAAFLAVSALAGGVIGGLGFESSALRAIRAALLVLVATWLRGAAGPEGMRDVFRGVLERLRRLGWAREAESLLERLDSAPRLAAAGRALVDTLHDVPRRPLPVADATASWVAAEATRGGAVETRPATRLAARPLDRVVVALVFVPLVGVVGHAL